MTEVENTTDLVEIPETDLNKTTCKRKFDAEDEVVDNKIKCLKVELTTETKDVNSEETVYYFENGLRKVYPYYFTYSTFCKGRWIGTPILEVFAREFRAYTKDHYRESILSGNLMVNSKKISPEYVLKDNDCITNKVHRHEVGVIACPIRIIHESDDLLVIDKPPSIPVHPCGRYRHNSLIYILQKENNLKDLHVIHRLDRLTSGVMIFTKTLRKSQELDEQVRTRKMQKEYICRVEGLFPNGVVTCDQPVEILSPKIGVCIVSSTGKESSTIFEKLSYNGKSSVVKCTPKTGRMHQIRVHLQYLGYPILNDPIYNHEEAFGPTKGKHGETGKSKEKLLSDLMEIHNLDKWLYMDEVPSISEEADQTSQENSTLLKILRHDLCMSEYTKLEHQYIKDLNKFNKEENCDFCKKRYRDPDPRELMIFLHAHCYKGDSFEFKSELPLWAADEWSEM